MNSSDTIKTTGLLSVKEFLTWAGLSKTSFYNEVNAGRLAARKIGRKTVITAEDAAAWRASLPAVRRSKGDIGLEH
ncbi:DNA-binding protein [Sinorhizobium meliloti]|uniref:helix-turn-helix transcriptional regulator n=1 Tax=Rhizobium meliloti TaxID=382 RepID=UPI000FDA1F0E|nr:helix-turn-helix domain-containing protein [Sinorhizobium meliloti]RVE90690.1 DNA-binding protein [Sinorhizobium meliloti]RVH45049.1 DNA-binding protein [Sinorhizobium meliloti]RVI93120.1 DNA-binding protein [Sinorhizobium meliloti]RVK13624.1 DNA-binding protein [Sinorhizobium meliloti]